ncbi:3'(2'),5'-bisphosphate nucleotidase CysQ [Sinorhizobium alkalisoli]|uniref:3'(2'),5'-bisphosphate nucleotidase CysQ n=1 Tax=Sinorhizobium alkalisoli TaxID=1752398 RepID=A0A1E3VDN4_9HYPH|nr:3'(2'),5'-bisphosphate nucleotidase CysQ [Sinorhizobium alkalisoli]MCA1494255.1 3'(2'),5'-bisphosphate nucleotidase CysQ [Ensifer sp. NBAIM29]MCG5479335.1 3'(2'),5'-bisphosphate nucleotidase CysQ [Sinorhizobium alkalisoli]ODR91699.1 3'(2'),5'-bisphosphate nucleotidase [Sinorhizobium alkalisoli]QFI67413.1 3'(2'),5'-bisphosphate nucleotidase [Sinorhizobium alkalisoli]
MLGILERSAMAAGQAILEVYDAGPAVTYKADTSPVTDADHRAERMILAELAAAFPDIPVIAEESVAAGNVPDIAGQRFFLVDPLDGTKEFVDRDNHFTVNIGLIENGEPVAGVVYAPALGVIYAAKDGQAKKAMVAAGRIAGGWSRIGCRQIPDRPVAVASRRHSSAETIAYLAEQGITDCETIGSSLKFCLLAEGRADLYPRFSRTMEWDTAAGDAVLRAAGGETLTVEGQPLAYGKRDQPNDSDFANPWFIARARRF